MSEKTDLIEKVDIALQRIDELDKNDDIDNQIKVFEEIYSETERSLN